jgi:hypothetical protein
MRTEKTKRFDKQVFRTLRPEINDALEKVAARYGIQLKLGNISFTEQNFTGKVEGCLLNDSGEAMTLEATKLNRNAALLKLPKAGESFCYLDEKFEAAGLTKTGMLLGKMVATPHQNHVNRLGRVFKFNKAHISLITMDEVPSKVTISVKKLNK